MDRGQGSRIARLDAPACVGISSESAETGAGGVHEDAVEQAIPRDIREGLRRITLAGGDSAETEPAGSAADETESAFVSIEGDDFSSDFVTSLGDRDSLETCPKPGCSGFAPGGRLVLY